MISTVMKILKFRCTLLSDVILNMKSVSVGSNKTLDFIPGNSFLGIVASQLYAHVGAEEALDLFHNGVVRYGDAHLAVGDVRSLKVPAAIYYPKLDSEKTSYVYYDHVLKKNAEELQLKQCREGFYAYSKAQKGVRAKVGKSFAIKSAYDRDARRSKDGTMYGYESLNQGLVFYFSVETDNDVYAKELQQALVGKKHIGHSRTSQYGFVEISLFDYQEAPSRPTQSKETIVYADGRLVFLDEYGDVTYRPTAEQLGVPGGRVLWEKSHVRTFQYAPWNFKRQAYDTDRCGLEKGSVLVVEGGKIQSNGSSVGVYRNEGFGKVIYNPLFLDSVKGTNGLAVYQLHDETLEQTGESMPKSPANTPLVRFLQKKENEETMALNIFREVNEFVNANRNRFKSQDFASQWGTIRSIALGAATKEDIEWLLFGRTRETYAGKTEPFAYLTHGKAMEKWERMQRLQNFKALFYKFYEVYPSKHFKYALINLASQMAKLNRERSTK